MHRLKCEDQLRPYLRVSRPSHHRSPYMAKRLDMFSTLKGSLLEQFYPAGWDLRRMDRCAGMSRAQLLKAARWWSRDFKPVVVRDVAEMDRRMGDAIADEIERTRQAHRPLILILPVGPMGMY